MELLNTFNPNQERITDAIAIEKMREESRILGACETIRVLYPNHLDKPSLLRQIFPYLSLKEVVYWARFYSLS
jgi:hypothetical protein